MHAKGLRIDPGPWPGIDCICCNCSIHVYYVVFAALINAACNFFSYHIMVYGQSTFLQWYSEALNKHLSSGTVHAGWGLLDTCTLKVLSSINLRK